MVSYGPPGGPYPGQPQDPWGDTPTDDYASGYPDPLTEAGLSQRSQQGSPAYGGRPAPAPGSVTGEVWGPPRPAGMPDNSGRSGRSGTTIGVIIIVVLLALAGGAAAAFFLTRDNTDKPTGGAKTAGPSKSSAPSATASPSTSSPNADAKVAKAGDCLVNRGTTEAPDMQKVPCAAKTYEVLKRIDGTSDKEKCKGTPGLTDWYFFDHSDDKQDFVLCLKKRA